MGSIPVRLTSIRSHAVNNLPSSIAHPKPDVELVALLGALSSVNVSFAVVRAFAGHALADVQRPVIWRLLRSNIDHRPVMTVALLRLIFQAAPPLNYALPMTAVHCRIIW